MKWIRYLSNTARARIAEDVRRLGSDDDNDVLAAARAIRATLAAEERLQWLRCIARDPEISAEDRAAICTLGVALKANPHTKPTPVELRLVNRRVAALYDRGVR